MHILIVKLGSIGDIVHTLPSLATIRRGLPEAEISWAVEGRTAEILRDNPFIDNLIEVDTRSLRGGMIIEDMLLGASKQIKNLRNFKFDVAIDFQGLLKSALITKLSGANKRWGFSRESLREPASRFLMTDTVAIAPQTHVIRKNLGLASTALGMPACEKLEFPITTRAEHVSEAEVIMAQCGQDFAILNPGGGWVTKLWPAEKFSELADRLWNEMGLTPVITTGPGETSLVQAVTASSRTGRLVFAVPSLKGFYELARRAKIYVGGDTGPTHIAVAANAPVVGLFGPTEWWRNGSPNPEDICVERSDIDCRVDCHRRTCSNWICMESDVAAVFDGVAQRIQKSGARIQPVSETAEF